MIASRPTHPPHQTNYQHGRLPPQPRPNQVIIILHHATPAILLSASWQNSHSGSDVAAGITLTRTSQLFLPRTVRMMERRLFVLLCDAVDGRHELIIGSCRVQAAGLQNYN